MVDKAYNYIGDHSRRKGVEWKMGSHESHESHERSEKVEGIAIVVVIILLLIALGIVF